MQTRNPLGTVASTYVHPDNDYIANRIARTPLYLQSRTLREKMEPRPVLYGSNQSPFVRKVRVCLIEKQIPFQFELVDVMGLDSAVFAHNPLGKIPCFVNEANESFYDSKVIAGYLDAVKPNPSLLPPDAVARAHVRRIEALADGVLDAGILLRWELNQRPAGTQDPNWIVRQTKKIDTGVDALARDLDSKSHYVGNSLTLADLAVGVMLGWLMFRFPDHPWREKHSNLWRLLEVLEQRESFSTTRPGS
jgi:glutathione S-transferase